MAKFGFDVTEVEVPAPRGEYEPLPAGEYVLKALEADEKKTSTGGTMIVAKFEVVKGEHAGRLIWQNFNTINNSKDAQRIGRQQLVSWATACGRPNEDETDKLLGKPFVGIVAIEPGNGSYKPSNKIKVFMFEQVAEAPPPAKKAPPVAKAAPAATNKQPWDD
jgi:hypothetical protein